MKAPPCFTDPETASLIREVCSKHRVDRQLLLDFCDIAMDHSGKGRAVGVDEEIGQALTRYLDRTKEDA